MIIQCDQCRAKFRLDDSRVTDRGVKVRCARCRHLFTVSKKLPESPADVSLSEQTPEKRQAVQTFAPLPMQPPDSQVPPADATFDMDLPEEIPVSNAEFQPAATEEYFFSPQEGDKESDDENDDFPSAEGGFEFNAFEFGGGGVEADETIVHPSPEAAAEKYEEVSGPDFSDDMFGAANSSSIEKPEGLVDFESGASSFDNSAANWSAEADGGILPFAQYGDAVAPVDLKVPDYEDEPADIAANQVDPVEKLPPQDTVVVPLMASQNEPEPIAGYDPGSFFRSDAASDKEEDLPPLSISSRRKQNSLFSGLIGVTALLVVGALGYLGFTSFTDDKGKNIQETGKISVRAVKASYVHNTSAGPLLVIAGEVVNEYPKPRAALQVRGNIFDARGQILVTKSAFGGNMLTEEQLASLPLEKIEAVMTNQFGDSLSNLEVAPGKAIPFMIVFADLSSDGRDFAVESVGSTVASAK